MVVLPSFYWKFSSLSSSERLFKIGEDLTKFAPKFGSQFQGCSFWPTR